MRSQALDDVSGGECLQSGTGGRGGHSATPAAISPMNQDRLFLPASLSPIVLAEVTVAVNFEDRRRFPRYALQQQIVVVQHGENGVELRGECRTFSPGGFGAVVEGELRVGRIVGIRIAPPFSKVAVSLEARIVYCENGLHGFEFVAPTETQRELIAALFRDAIAASADASKNE
jgi:hypothetical protein